MKLTIGLLSLVLGVTSAFAGETIRIAIGTQDTTTNTAAGGPVPRELKLLEKYLPTEGKYKDVKYEIEWKSFPSGPPLNSELLANKLDIGQMADFPAILGATAFKAANNGVKTYYIASLSGGVHGAGNGLVVPADSPIQSIAELKGKTISVPFGSTAHAFLLRALQNAGLDPNKDVNLISQAPDVGGSALKANQIDAHANFVPFAELFPFRGFARKILDGQSTGLATTHGIQVRSDFAEKYPELVVAYLKATLEADRLIRENPEKLSEQIGQWTGIDPEVVYAFHGPQGIQARDYTLKPEFVDAIKQAQETLKILKKIEDPINVDEFVNDKYIRQAAKEYGLDYDARLKDYRPEVLAGKDYFTGEEVTDPNQAGQIWVKGEDKVRLYKTVGGTFAALEQLKKEGKPVRVAYVHDRSSGLKLFADKVWYVRSGNELAAFLEKSDAEKWAQSHQGELLTYAQATEIAAHNQLAAAR
jgi:NitT/TauT family transport system substrate-binding protein